MQLILVVGKVDMINRICQMLSFVESYCQLILLKKNDY